MYLFIDSLIPSKVRHNGTVISPFIYVYKIYFFKAHFAKLALKDHLSITTTRSHDHWWSLYTSSTVPVSLPVKQPQVTEHLTGYTRPQLSCTC